MPTSVRAPFERLPGFLDREAERDALDGLLRDVRSGHGRTLVVRGEAGVGKSALLEYMVEGAADMQVVRALGVESEMELAFASVHLLLAPLLDRVQELPGPHISSVRVQAGRTSASQPAGPWTGSRSSEGLLFVDQSPPYVTVDGPDCPPPWVTFRSCSRIGQPRRYPFPVRSPGAHDYGQDLYTEAAKDDDTLANLGPLRPLAGVWSSADGADVHPIGAGSNITGRVVDGSEHNVFVERYELQPIDPQTNGPQLFYGLRYHTHIVKPGEVETFHDQVGYWLWEPAAGSILHTLAIPRGQVLLAAGTAEADATEFEVAATVGSEVYGILSNPFLYSAFRTVGFQMRVTVNGDGTWSYEERTQLQIPDRQELIDHVDRNRLKRAGQPMLNPLAASADRRDG